MSEKLLSVSDLSIGIDGKQLVNGVSFAIQKQQTLGVVGESGSGKSLTALSLIGLLPMGSVVKGSICLDSEEIANGSQKRMRSIRGKRIAMSCRGAKGGEDSGARLLPYPATIWYE